MGQSYSVEGMQVTVPDKYGLTEGWRSELVITPTTGDTCDHVTKFDGEYTCQVTDGIRNNRSTITTVKTQCEQ